MSLAATAADEDPATKAAAEIHLPADIDWEMLDKSKFFVLGAGLFSGVSAALHPVVLLKTRLQVSRSPASSLRTAAAILRHEGPRGFYRGFGTSLAGTVPARAVYMAALEVTKSSVGSATARIGMPEPVAATISSAAAGLSAAIAAQVVWTPIDVVSQRLMVQGCDQGGAVAARYCGGVDAFRKIMITDGVKGLYRGFGMSIFTYAPSNAVWWATYSLTQRTIWGGIGYHLRRKGVSEGTGNAGIGGSSGSDGGSRGGSGCAALTPDYKSVMLVQAVSATVAGGMSALITMPLDTVKTRMQVLDGEESGSGGRKAPPMSMMRTVKSLLKEGGWAACYRGLGPRWVSMSMSATTMITTYELLKRLSAKSATEDSLA